MCDGYGYIQSECANVHKKKSKVTTSVWSNDHLEGSQEDDNNNISHIVFTSSLIFTDNLVVRKTAESIMKDFIENFVATNEKCSFTGTNFDSGEESKVDEEASQDAYENRYP